MMKTKVCQLMKEKEVERLIISAVNGHGDFRGMSWKSFCGRVDILLEGP
jgi:hypothetical protein